MPWSPRLDADEWFHGLRTDWRICREATPSAAHATRAIVAENADSLTSDPTRSIFWLILAHYQWRDGCLQPGVKRKALAIIQRGPRPILWLNPGSRVNDFERLRRLLLSPQPRPRRCKSRPLTPTQARPGDLIQVVEPEGDPWLLLHVVRIGRYGRARVPVCVLFRWPRRALPTGTQIRRLRPIAFPNETVNDQRGGVRFSSVFIEGLTARNDESPGATLIRRADRPARFTTSPLRSPVHWPTIRDQLVELMR